MLAMSFQRVTSYNPSEASATKGHNKAFHAAAELNASEEPSADEVAT